MAEHILSYKPCRSPTSTCSSPQLCASCFNQQELGDSSTRELVVDVNRRADDCTRLHKEVWLLAAMSLESNFIWAVYCLYARVLCSPSPFLRTLMTYANGVSSTYPQGRAASSTDSQSLSCLHFIEGNMEIGGPDQMDHECSGHKQSPDNPCMRSLHRLSNRKHAHTFSGTSYRQTCVPTRGT